MKLKVLSSCLLSLAMIPAYASQTGGVGLGINAGLLSGAGLEVNYPINEYVQVRGMLSTGLSLSEDSTDTDVTYQGDVEGSINRIAIDYHPFGGTFFLSTGYALNEFGIALQGSGTAADEVGDTTINGNYNINGELAWDDGATLSLGWGHSPEQGWGAALEIGAIFTGAAKPSLTGTVTSVSVGNINDVQNDLDNALKDEEETIKKDLADFEILPIVQLGVTYRF